MKVVKINVRKWLNISQNTSGTTEKIHLKVLDGKIKRRYM